MYTLYRLGDWQKFLSGYVQQVGLDMSEEEEDGGYVSCMLQITAYHGDDGHLFQDLPTVDDLDEYFESVKEVIDSHKKK